MLSRSICLLMVSLIVVNSEIFTDPSANNFVVNGDFSKPLFPGEYIFTGDFPGWWVKQGEIGWGRIYNKRWGNTQVIQLDGKKNTNYKSKVKLPASQTYELSFDWAARDGVKLESSKLEVYFNEKLVFRGWPTDYQINHEFILLEGNKGENWLQIRGAGISDSFGATVDNVELFVYVERNFVVNGDFSKPLFPGEYIITGDFPGWWVKQGEIGWGRIYNKRWGNTQVIELDAKQNTVYKSKVQLPASQSYELRFDWAARDGVNLESSKLEVYFNEQIVFKSWPIDYEINHQSIIVEGKKGQNWLAIKGTGTSDKFGATVDNVGVFIVRNHPQYPDRQWNLNQEFGWGNNRN